MSLARVRSSVNAVPSRKGMSIRVSRSWLPADSAVVSTIVPARPPASAPHTRTGRAPPARSRR
jgi:hypothetical protein